MAGVSFQRLLPAFKWSTGTRSGQHLCKAFSILTPLSTRVHGWVSAVHPLWSVQRLKIFVYTSLPSLQVPRESDITENFAWYIQIWWAITSRRTSFGSANLWMPHFLSPRKSLAPSLLLARDIHYPTKGDGESWSWGSAGMGLRERDRHSEAVLADSHLSCFQDLLFCLCGSLVFYTFRFLTFFGVCLFNFIVLWFLFPAYWLFALCFCCSLSSFSFLFFCSFLFSWLLCCSLFLFVFLDFCFYFAFALYFCSFFIFVRAVVFVLFLPPSVPTPPSLLSPLFAFLFPLIFHLLSVGYLPVYQTFNQKLWVMLCSIPISILSYICKKCVFPKP